MKVAIVGSRHFKNWLVFRHILEELPIDWSKIGEIVSGGAPGADSLASRWSIETHKNLTIYTPEWGIGPQAGPLRNAKIVDRADILVAFLIEGFPCKGTRDCIRQAADKGLQIFQFVIDEFVATGK